MGYRESEEFKILCGRADEAVARAAGTLVSTSFLNPAEQYFLREYLKVRGLDQRAVFFGGAPGAQRRKMFALPEYVVSFAEDADLFAATRQLLGDDAFDDIRTLKISGGGFRSFTHRDYLGSILSLGLERTAVGDIVPIDECSAYIFVSAKIAPFLLETEIRVASDRGRICEARLPDGFVIERKYKEVTDTIASGRLDCVIAALCNLSREAAKEKIRSKEVEQNYEEAAENDSDVVCGDVISVRGIGKFEIVQIGGTTKSGRLRLIAKKYI